VSLLAVAIGANAGCQQDEVKENDLDAQADVQVSDTAQEVSDTHVARDTTDTTPDAAGPVCSADAGYASLPAPQAGSLYVPRSSDINVDGAADEYADRWVEFADASGTSDNTVKMATAWRNDRLYLAFRVTDAQVDPDGDADPWRNDGVEFAIDPDSQGGNTLSGDEVKWIVTADGAIQYGESSSGQWSSAANDALEAAAQMTADGYVIEVVVPASALGMSYDVGNRIDVEIVNNDRDGGQANSFGWKGESKQFSTPSAWGWLELATDACRRVDDGGNQDAGQDASDTSDTSDTSTPEDTTTDTGPDTSNCQPEPFDTIVVGAGQTRRFSVGDGDVLENKLIDITANNAKYSIVATGNDWTIRNIGIKGYFDGDAKSSPMRVRVDGQNSDGLVENIYLGDGGGTGRTGIFVIADHAGTLRLRKINVQHWGDNGIYGSSPGNPSGFANKQPGGQGIVRIFDSFANDNGSGGFRIGTDGSFCDNCVSINARQFAFWGYYHNTKFINCDAANAASSSFAGNARYWIDRGVPCGSIEVVNSRHSGSSAFGLECQKIGTPQSNPRTQPPAGVPRTPEQAANGCGGQ
jgi:hypothetical protein